MNKRIVICADGTWNRPEKKPGKDQPSNVLRLARAIKPFGRQRIPQQVFYDWGVGSYHDPVIGGATGKGLHKNVMDDYRFIVQNYSPGDELFLFGFSRGAYTVRSLCGLINNCGILKRPDAGLIQSAFNCYKNSRKDHAPQGRVSVEFRNRYSHSESRITFVGVWDTVGALGIPFSFLGLLDKKDEFYDTKMGSNVVTARHALAIDEVRSDFEPTILEQRPGLDLKQVWFAGVHSDIGGAYRSRSSGGELLSDIPLKWMMREAARAGLVLEPHLRDSLNPEPTATLHKSRRHIYRSKRPYYRPIDHGRSPVLIHRSVQERWNADERYRPKELKKYVNTHGWTTLTG